MWMIWAAWIVMKRSLREYLLKESNMRMIMKSAIMRSKRQTSNSKLPASYIKMQEAIMPLCQVKLQMSQSLSKILQRSLLSGKAISQHRNSCQVGHRTIHSWAEWTKDMILTWIIWNTVITKTAQFTWRTFSPHQIKTLSFQNRSNPTKTSSSCSQSKIFGQNLILELGLPTAVLWPSSTLRFTWKTLT